MANLRTNNLSGEQGQNAYRGSVQFNDADYLQIADSADIEIGSNDYTVEFWAIFTKKTSSTDYEEIVNKGYPFQIYRNTSNNQVALAVDSNTSTYEINTTFGTASRGDWHHIAVSRSGNTTKAFLNGIEGLSSTANTSIDDVSTAFTIGTYGHDTGSYQFRGVISNVRVVIGTALYTADFTPPTEELKIVDGTAILCCQDSDDPTQEATGKTITGFGNLATAGYLETQPKVIPPYGVDAGNTFGGPIQQSSQGYMYFPTGRTEERGRGRGFVGGGNNPSSTNTIQFVELRTSGNSLNFGDLTAARQSTLGALANATRAIWGGGQIHPANNNIMDFITTSTTGNATDFGDLTVARRNLDGTGNQTRGLFCGGQTPTLQDVIDFVTIANLGNATDFGNLSVARKDLGGASSPTRGLFLGGNAPSGSDVIDFVTIATAGNATDFGNLTVARATYGAVSSKTRAVAMGGNAGAPGYANYNTIDFVTIASAGNATDFGDLITAISNASFASNSIIGLSMGGSNGTINTIEFITIATTGNGSLFGELLSSQGEGAGCSDSHGGLS